MKSGSITYIFLILFGFVGIFILVTFDLLTFNIKIPFSSSSSTNILFFSRTQNSGIVTIPAIFLLAWPLAFIFGGLYGLAYIYGKKKLGILFSSILCLSFGGIFTYAFYQDGAIIPLLFGALIFCSGIYLLIKLLVSLISDS